MMCIVLQAKKNIRYWQGRRSVEGMAYHPLRKEVSILLGVLLEIPRESRYVRIIHSAGDFCLCWAKLQRLEMNVFCFVYDEAFPHQEKTAFLKGIMVFWLGEAGIQMRRRKIPQSGHLEITVRLVGSTVRSLVTDSILRNSGGAPVHFHIVHTGDMCDECGLGSL